MSIETILTIIAVLLLLGVLASIASNRLGVPALVLFLFVGMLAGVNGPGGIPFHNPWLAQSLGVVALTLILFEGGINTDWRTIRPVAREGVLLATVGVILTSLILGVFASWLLHLPLLYGLLLGAIVSPTDSAAVFSVLKSGSSRLKSPLPSLLEVESALNDPMAVCLTLGLLGLIQDPMAQSPLASVGALLWLFLRQMVLGAVMGLLTGQGMVWVMKRTRLDDEGLYPVLTLGLIFFTYGVTTLLGGSGFLAVYVAAITLGGGDFMYRKSLIRFHEGLAWLMQIVMFLTLGLFALPAHLPTVLGSGLLIAAFLIVVARPVSVFVSLFRSAFGMRERLMISWVGLRGAVPIVLATFPLLAGLPQARDFFDMVFFIVLSSILLQGTTLTKIARWLKVDDVSESKPRTPLEFIPSGISRNDLVEVSLPHGSPMVNRRIGELSLPDKVLIVLIGRSHDFLVPNGDTLLQEGDMLLVLAEKERLNQFFRRI